MPTRYNLSEENGFGESGGTGSKMASGKGGGSSGNTGCHVSVLTGFVLMLLAMLVAVGVGVVVHFAGRDSGDISCSFPAESMTQLLQQMQQGSNPNTTPAAVSTTTPLGSQTTAPPQPTTATPQAKGYRLPPNLKPVYYDLEIAPDFYGDDPSTFTFQGHVGIVMECVMATDVISLNAKDLSIATSDVSVTGVTTSASVEVLETSLDDGPEVLRIRLKDPLSAGARYRVDITFSGPLTDDLHGLYLSSYTQGNQTAYLATTQFEAPDAREAFPCFDEPAIKAQFNVTLLRKPNYVTLSNTQIVRTEPRPNGMVADVYDTTPPMSTYLLAFIVCDFVHVQGTTPKGIEYGVWARRELSDMMAYALDTGMTVLDYYGDVFATDFPLKKQDMIAIPDFAAGAMENWGLITYRESDLLYKPRVTSESQRQRVTLVIAHELAHQWFGNLVTLAWWDDLWLNEGFAEFVEYIGMDKVAPEWKVWEQFAVDAVQMVFKVDQIVSSHPLYSPADTFEQVDQYFDNISYEKGASVIRMIEFCLGQATFRRGLQRYLQQHKYGNANHTDLWTALGQQAREENKDLDIAAIMNTWTLQMGFPVVMATRTFTGDVTVTQKRFLINPDATDPHVFHSPFGYQWYVPLTLASSKDPNFNVTESDVKWMSSTEPSKTFTPWVAMPTSEEAGGWFLLNVHQYGYYRVNYHHANWNALVGQLKKDHKVIPPVNRAQLIDDAWNLASAGETTVDIALSTLEYLKNEEDYVPWTAASKLLGDLKRRMTGTAGFGALERFIQDRTRPLFTRLGLDDTDATALQSYTRAVVAKLACKAGLEPCVQAAVALFRQWRQEPENNPISPSVRQLVYCTAVKEGDDSDWSFLRMRFQQETAPAERDDLRVALACSSRPWVLRTLLSMALAGQDIRRDDVTGTIADVAKNEVGTDIAWNFVRENWDVIIIDFAQSNSRLKRMINSIAAAFHTDFYQQQLLDFVRSHPDLDRAEVVLNQALEAVQFNLKWNSNYYPQIVQWLAARGYKEFSGSEADIITVTAENVRLPTTLRPLHYDLSIEPYMYDPDPTTFTFNGTLTMAFHCLETTDEIFIHANQLELDNIEVRSAAGQPPSPGYSSHRLDTALEWVVISVGAPLLAGRNYSVTLTFRGLLDNATLDGLYLSSYRDATGTVYLATTQFEPTDARKAFPCMDEPGLKATFTVTVVRRDFNGALSNMPLQTSTDLGGGRVADRFRTTLPMSTYLVAFIVSNFQHKSKLTKRNTTYEVWSRPDALDQVDFALDLGIKVIEFYEDYFGVPFPLPKQSMAAIPDFAAGAMENWGLITYRETRILLQTGVSSSSDLKAGAATIAHELAHMWFGDLVSPVWWDELWLNEGFARFMQYLGVDHVYPEWNMFDSFVSTVVHGAMSSDGMMTSHPVYVPVATPAEINAIFDSISYNKGASVLRMIRHAIGEETFKNGLTNYLNKHKFSNANHMDLWDALGQQATSDGRDVNVADVMDTWTLQMNYPVVKVTRQGQTLTLSQERFMTDPDAKDPMTYTSPFGYKWDIPFTYTTSTNPTFTASATDIHWMPKDSENTSLVVPSLSQQPNAWVIGNLNVMGFYRVTYDTDNWRRLTDQLNTDHTVIRRLNRVQIIDDAWSLASGGYIDQTTALRTIEYLDQEMDYVPWQAASKQLDYVGKMLSTTGSYGAFQMFLANKTRNQFDKLGMTGVNASLEESLLRGSIVDLACSSGVGECVTQAKALFASWRSNPGANPIPAELRSVVYCAAVADGTTEDWNFLYGQFTAETNVNEKGRQQKSLACSPKLWILSKLCDRALYSGDIRSQDAYGVIGRVATNPAGTALVWAYVRENWDDIFQRYSKDTFALKRLVGSLAAVFNTQVQLQELQAFVDSHPQLGIATTAFQTAMESTRANIRWMQKNYDIVEGWLAGLGFAV